MGKARSEGELRAYLAEHLNYERNMLRFTFQALYGAEGYLWCAIFESFGVHARNLYDFLRHEGQASNTIRADHYVPGRKRPTHSDVDTKMNKSFFHLSTSRLENKPVTFGDAAEIGKWIDTEWARWVGELDQVYRELTDTAPTCLAIPQDGGSPSATNNIGFG